MDPNYSDNIPKYVDPAVLKPGTTVVAMLDASQTRLVVLRVEPMLVCRSPEGKEVTVFAHEVVSVDDEPIPFRAIDSYCICGAVKPYDHNLGCPHATYPTRDPVGCDVCEAKR